MFKRVLVVDKSDHLANFVRACLRCYWPEVQVEVFPTSYSLPPAGFDWSPYQLVISEFQLGRNGETAIELLRDIQERRPKLPLVVVAAGAASTVGPTLLRAGAAYFIDLEDCSPRKLALCLATLFTDAGQSDSDRSLSIASLGITKSHRPGGQTDLSEMVGSRIPGYSLVRKIADGGMASILLAQRLEDHLEVILKVLLLQDGAQDPELLPRFMREYELIGKLNHRNIVQIYERGFAADFAYISMEHCPAGNLKSRMGQPLSPDRALRYVREIAQGLSVAHECGIVHRDLKPSNILFKQDDTVAIADFGIAKDLTHIQVLTTPGALLGTPYYASPEQLLNQSVDARTDLYSLGVMLYEMLTGKRPFSGSSLSELIFAHTRSDVPQLPATLATYQPVIDGLLAKDPDERFQSTAEALAGLEWVKSSAAPVRAALR